MSDTSSTAVGVIVQWHRRMHPDQERRLDGNRAARAQLRRCMDAGETLLHSATHELLQNARSAGMHPNNDPRLLLLVPLLAHIAPSASNVRFARCLGQKDAGGNQLMKAARFQSLLRALSDPDQSAEADATRLTALRRAASLAGNGAFATTVLIEDILFFNEKIARRWSYEYWQTPMALATHTGPATSEITAEDTA